MKKIFILIFFLTSLALGADEIWFDDLASQSRYCRIIDVATKYIYDRNAGSFAASPTWGNSAVQMTENATNRGVYYGDFPSESAKFYLILVYEGAYGAAANTDTKVGRIEFNWDGSAEITPKSIETKIDTIDDYIDTEIADIPTVAEFEARTILSADYVVVTDTIAGVTTVTTLTGHTAQTGDSYAIVSSGTYGNSALKTLIDDVPTNAELNLRTLATADYFLFGTDTVANVSTVATLTGHTVQTGDSYAILKSGGTGDANDVWTDIVSIYDIVKSGGSGDPNAMIGYLLDIQGTGFLTATDSLEAIRNRGDTHWYTPIRVVPPQFE